MQMSQSLYLPSILIERSKLMITSAPPAIRILIVDDDALYRQTLRLLCEIKGGFKVVGEAENGLKAIEKAQQLQPDVVLMDIRMPILNGVEATNHITKLNPLIRVIMLTVQTRDEYLFEAIKAGARGYLLKDVDPRTLVKSIQAVHCGETLLDSFLTSKLFDEIRRHDLAPAN